MTEYFEAWSRNGCRLWLSFALALSMLAGCSEQAPPGSVMRWADLGPERARRQVLELLKVTDRDFDPCDDFYNYACTAVLHSPTRGNDGHGELDPIERSRLTAFALIWEMLANDRLAADPEIAQAQTYFRSCQSPRRAAVDALRPLIAEIDTIQNLSDFLRTLGGFHRHGIVAIFETRVLPDIRGSGIARFHLIQGGPVAPATRLQSHDEFGAGLWKAYKRRIASTMKRLEDIGLIDSADADTIMTIDSRLVRREDSGVFDPGSFAVRTVAELSERSGLAWQEYFTGLHAGNPVEVILFPGAYFERIGAVLADYQISDLRAYLTWRVAAHVDAYIESIMPPLQVEVERMSFDFTDRTPAWLRCMTATETLFPDVFDRLYAEHHSGEGAIEAARAHLEAVRVEARKAILSIVRDEAVGEVASKLDRMRFNLGFPSAESEKVVLKQDDWLGNSLAIAQEFSDRVTAREGKRQSAEVWRPERATSPGFYKFATNTVQFSLLLVRPPFFDRELPAAVNFARFGFVAGHEIVHGVDRIGRCFDADGGLTKWASADAQQSIEKFEECLTVNYATWLSASIRSLVGYSYDEELGKRTRRAAAETLADHIGLRAAYRAFRASQSTTTQAERISDEQAFFLAFAQLWCRWTTTWEDLAWSTSDDHPPNPERVNAVLSSLPEFAEAFSCAEGTRMRPSWSCTER